MNLQPIIDIIQNKKSVSSTELEQAKELHKKFPFTSIFPMIILRGLKEKGDIHFESELRKLAIQIGDREVLERYLDGIEVLSKSASAPIAIGTQQPIEQEGLVESELESESDDKSEHESPSAALKKRGIESELESESESPSDTLRNLASDDKSELEHESEEVLDTQEEKIEESVAEDNAEPVVEEREFKEKVVGKSDNDTPKEIKKSSSKSLELDPETKRIIAELQKKYEEEEQSESESESESEGKNPSAALRSFESDEKSELDSESESEDGISKDTATSIEEKVGSSEEAEKEKPKKEKKVSAEKSKKDKKRKKDKKKLKEKLDNQVKDSPFKFKEFKGEDDEYYHLEIDFSDLEPIYQEDEEEDVEDFADFDFANHPEIDKLVDGFIHDKYDVIEKESSKETKKSASSSDQKSPGQKEKKKSKEVKKKKSSGVDSSFKKPVKIGVSEKSEMTFLDWLKANKSASASAQQPNEQEREEEQTETSRIIDRFIDENPSISQVKKEFFSPTKNAKRSLEDEMEIVSETLAELHVFQENYSKAKKIYEKLILKFPEKKSLFAEKLEEIAFLRKKK